MSKKSRNIAVGSLLIGLAGYAAGLLTAPKSGKETRKVIQKKAIKAKTDAEKKLKTLHSELSELIVSGRAKVGNVKTKVKLEFVDALDKAQIAREKVREVLSALHEGDADDKDLKKAIKEVNIAIEHLKKYVNKNAQT